MLAQMIRRLTLTGLLMASLVGTGLLFGSAGPIAPIQANVGENTGFVVERVETPAESIDAALVVPAPVHKAGGSQLRWPFFTFGRKRSNPSW